MEVFRLSTTSFSNALTASGKENRWNHDNEFIIYSSCTRALATLELTVHRNNSFLALKYEVMVISISDREELFNRVYKKDLPANWRDNTMSSAQLRKIGSEWYTDKKSLVLQVPSAVIPQEYNYLINTHHPDFKIGENIDLVRTEEYFWDNRLIIP